MYIRPDAKTAPPDLAPMLGLVPRKITPSSPFGKKLVQLRLERGLTQADLAELIGSSQRNVSHYETVAEFPPTDVLVKLASVLKVSTDDLLGLRSPRKAPEPKEDPEERRLWKKFQAVRSLPEKDQRAVIRLVNSLVSAKDTRRGGGFARSA